MRTGFLLFSMSGTRLAYNGPAIWGGCVTRRKHRAGSWYFSQKAVTVQALPAGRQGGYGALFAVMVQILLSITRIAVQVWSEPRIYPRLQCWLWALAQCRGTNYLEGSNLSRYRILIWCRGACPGATTITKLSYVQEHLPAGRQESKKCDKQLTYIVRVSTRGILKLSI
jgi:hypothetical protein